MPFKHIKKLLFSNNSSLLHRIFFLLVGYGLAQFILLVTSPVLTRLYSPQIFGHFGFLFSLITVFLSISTLRYEYAMPLATTKKGVAQLVQLCLLVTIVTSIILVLCYLIIPTSLYHHKISPSDAIFCLAAIMVQAAGQVYSMPLVSDGKTNKVAIGRLFQNIAMVSFQFLFAFITYTMGAGLMIGYIIGLICNVFYYRYQCQRILPSNVSLNLKQIVELGKKYYKFPLYSSWSGFLDSMSTALPVFFIGALYGKATLGLYFLVFRVFIAPTGLVSRAVSLVITKEFADHQKSKQPMLPLFLKLSGALGVFAVCYFFVMFFLSYYTGIIFGEKWQHAGFILRTLAWVISIIAIASPLSTVFAIIHRNGAAAIWQVMYIGATFVIIYLAREFSFHTFILRLVFVWFLLYLLYWVIALLCVRKWDKNLCVV